MNWPAFLWRKYGRAAFVTMIVPKRFVSICARKSHIGVSSTDERLPYPALLITTSSEPKAPIAAFTALAAADSSVTSSAKSLIWSPWRSDRSRSGSMSRAVANTLLPAARPASTIARPRPRELPVTNQTCAIQPSYSHLGVRVTSRRLLIHCEHRSDNRVWQSRSREKFTERCLLAFFFPLALRSQTEIVACSTHNRRGTGEMRRAELICGRHFYVVDDQNIHGRLSGFQL